MALKDTGIETTLDFSGVMVPTERPEYLKQVKRFTPPLWTNATTFREVLAATYQSYLISGKVNAKLIHRLSKVPVETIDLLLADAEFQAAMHYRGINYSGETFLTPEMDATLIIIMDPHDGRTMAQKLRAAGISNAKYQGFMRNPTFKRLVNEQSEQLIANTHEALVGIAKKVGEGDLKAMQFQLEVNKRYNPRSEALMGQQEFLGNVVEIITRNITDPALLTKIMNDFKLLSERSEIQTQPALIEGTILNG